jgi:hypothetical protein
VTTSGLIELLTAIHKKEDLPYLEMANEILQNFMLSYKLHSGSEIPEWLARLFIDLLHRRNNRYYFSDIDNMSLNLFCCLQDDLHWPIVDSGESIEILLEKCNMSAIVSMQGKVINESSSCSYHTSELLSSL